MDALRELLQHEVVYWLNHVNALIWALLYLKLRADLKKKFISRGQLMDAYHQKALDAKNKATRMAYMQAVRTLEREQESHPKTYTERFVSWLKETLS